MSQICFFNPSTCQRQSFSISEKYLYYIAKNVTNAKTFQKLVETCKYFYKINPVIVVPLLYAWYQNWVIAYHGLDGNYHVEFEYDQPRKFKMWITHLFSIFPDPELIPLIYKNDAEVVDLLGEPLKLEEFLFFVGNAEKLSMRFQSVKYENGKIVQLEDIVKNIPNVKSLDYTPCFDENDVNCNTVKKLTKIENFKRLSKLNLFLVSEAWDVVEMFNLILENKHIEVELMYRNEISDVYKELVREYSRRLEEEKEDGCNSVINYSPHPFNYYFDDGDENEDLPFPLNIEEDEE